jgi:lysozyme
MNLEAMKEEIKQEEGFSNKVYFDILGYGTIGFGHLVTPLDKFKEGVVYDNKELEKVFEYDFQIAYQDGISLTKDLDIPDEAKEIVIHMCFQMGKPKVSKFKKMFEALRNKRYDIASTEMLDSLWHKQHTPARAERLANRMRKLI